MISLVLLASMPVTGQVCSATDTRQIGTTQTESEAGSSDDTIIVDSDSSVKSYPTMEEEMDMYVELRSEPARAFFFPNPSTGVVWIEHNLGSGVTVEILESAGRVVFEAKEMSSIKLDLTDFPRGRYSIQLTAGDTRLVRELEVR